MSDRSKYAQASRALLRDSLLDAAAELMHASSWAEISMASIATEAGVSRQTLYNEFGTREEFAQAFALRAAHAFLAAVEQAIAAHPEDPCRAIEAAFGCFLREAEKSPMVRAIVQREPGADELLALFTTRGKPVFELASEQLTRAVRAHWSTDDAAGLQVVVEGLIRLAVSHASLPTSTPASAARSVATLLEPFVRALLKPAEAPKPRRRARP
jgi:AcrR family transcriptional regulator